MKKSTIIVTAFCLTAALIAPAGMAYADVNQNTLSEQYAAQMGMQGGRMGGQMGGGMMGGGMMGGAQNISETPGEVVYSSAVNTAADLAADTENAQLITMSDSSNEVEINEAGTYIITGTCSDGNIVVKKGTSGVVLILQDLDLTSTTGAAVSVNKEASAKIIISGTVTLTDAENPADETSSDAEVADAYDGAVIKAKANSSLFLTGDGTLNLNGTAKNGIKGGDDASVIIDSLTLNIAASNDAVNANYDLTILSGNVTIYATDDALHAEHILTLGSEDGTGPTVNIVSCSEGLEATVVNILGGDIAVSSSDDAINAANKDGLYAGELTYSLNQLGGTVTVNSNGDGYDSNGNVNLIAGTAVISSRAGAGEAGIDYDGQYYCSESFELSNNSGTSGPDNMGGMMGGGGMPGGGMPGGQMGGGMPGGWGGNRHP